MKRQTLNFEEIIAGSDWTLFMDRDGVVNKQIHNGYVLSIEQFEFLPGVLEAMPILNLRFNKIFIVTNQQCVGYGLISVKELDDIHHMMLAEINNVGGRIDHIFVATNLESEQNPYRKPGIGMANHAKRIYPDIQFSKSIMIGDSKSDMMFGRNAKIFNVVINSQVKIKSELYDHSCKSLLEFAKELQ